MKIKLLNLLVCFTLFFLTSCNNYTVIGTCVEYRMPNDEKVSIRILDEKLDDRILQTTKVNSDGSFCFKGYVDEPCIIYITSTDNNGGYTWHSMGILEEGDIILNCKNYEVNRTFFDCQGTGTPLNDLIQSFYKQENEIFNRVKESEKIKNTEFVQTLYYYPTVKKHLLDFVENNKTNMAGIFMALSYLYLNSSGIMDLPIEIQNNPLVKRFVEEKQ